MIKDENNIPKAIEALEQIDGSEFRAGILDGGKEEMIAHVQEYGATIRPKKGDYLMVPMPDGSFRKLSSVTIPARPFIAQTVIRHESDWKSDAGKMIELAIGGSSVSALKTQLANKMAEQIKQTMSNGSFAANAPLTIERKGSSQPLIDTGTLQGAIRGEVEK